MFNKLLLKKINLKHQVRQIQEKRKEKVKRKKLTAKERKKRKQELLEQQRQEELRIQKQKEEEQIRTKEREMVVREERRLLEEKTTLETLRNEKTSSNEAIRSKEEETQENIRYMSCNHSTDPHDEADVRSFISIWKEIEDNDLSQFFERINLATKLIEDLDLLRYDAEVKKNYQV